MKVVPLGGRITLGPFDIEFVSVAHSIPESNALIIRTSRGAVLHTGDWKLDPTPVIGPPTDEGKLRALGEAGCLAVVGDSTNAVRDGRSPSETEVAATLKTLIADAPARVAVTTFASNVARLRAVADAARACDREVVVVGRAMDRIVQVARETGYLEGVQDFRGTDAYGYLPRDKVVALCTGSQGEGRAALARIALDEHPDVTLVAGDRVIFSSRTIPGNEKAVGKVVNGLVRQGIEIITDRTHLVHVSGHPRRAEMADLYSWVKPRIAVPVHGEALHLAEHAALARKARRAGAVSSAATATWCGSRRDRQPSSTRCRRAASTRTVACIIDGETRTVADRRRLSFVGIVSVAVALDDAGAILGDPEVEFDRHPRDRRPRRRASRPRLRSRGRHRRAAAAGAAARSRCGREAVKRAVRAAIAANWGKKPMCLVHILTV